MITGRRLAGGWLVILGLGAAWAYFLLGGEGVPLNPDLALLSPSYAHYFGTDSLGRDLFLRTLVGTRISLGVGVLSAFLAAILAIGIGGVAGLLGGWVDRVFMRFTDIFCSLPSFIVVTVLGLYLQEVIRLDSPAFENFLVVCVAIGLTHWFGFARIVRSLVLKGRVQPYIESARALGASEFRVLRSHILPNIRSQLLTLAVLQVPANILYESFLSFVGLGTQAPQTSWGVLIQEGWRSMALSPHLILFPSVFLFLTVWSIQVLCKSE